MRRACGLTPGWDEDGNRKRTEHTELVEAVEEFLAWILYKADKTLND